MSHLSARKEYPQPPMSDEEFARRLAALPEPTLRQLLGEVYHYAYIPVGLAEVIEKRLRASTR